MPIDPRLERCESGLIIQINRVSHALAQLTKQVVVGYARAELVGVIADLRFAASEIDRIGGEWPDA
jgi:hypothetical protein